MLFFILLFPGLNYAGDAKVLDWTTQTFLTTLTLDYKNMTDQLNQSKPYYTPSAWAALKSFLGDKAADIQNEQLTLHPKALGSANIVDSGTIADVTYWRINQTISIPELNISMNVTLVVIKAKNPPFLIQSVNMIKILN